MINFTKLELHHKSLFEEYLKDYDFNTYDYSFLTLYQWRKMCHTEFAMIDGALVIKKYTKATGAFFMKPLGYTDENIKEIVSVLGDYKKDNPDFKHLFGDVEGSFLHELKDSFGDAVTFAEDSDNFDYIYSSEDLMQLKGEKYHRKKNLYNQFVKHNQFEVKELDNPLVVKDCIDFAKEWYRQKGDNSYILKSEIEGIEDVLNNLESFNLCAIAVYVEGRMAGFAYGEKVNGKMSIVHCEKADTSFTGLYAFLNKELVDRFFYNTELVNRQDDLGLPGLRKAKMSYNPVKLEKKYFIDKVGNG